MPLSWKTGSQAAAALVCALAVGCGRPRPVDRHLLFTQLLHAERVVVELPEGLSAPRGWTPELPEGWPRVQWVEAGAGAPLPASGPRILVGTWDTPGLAPVLERLGLARAEGGFRFEGDASIGTFDLLAATCADPERRGSPLTVLLAGELADAAALLEQLVPSARPYFHAWRRGDLLAEGQLDPLGALLPDRVRRFEPERLAQAALVRNAAGIVLRADAEAADRIDGCLAALEGARDRVLAATGGGLADAPELDVRVFAHPEDLFRATGRSELAVRNPITGAVAMVLLPGGDVPGSPGGLGHIGDGGAAYARSLARALLGPPAAAWVEDALGVHAADGWWGRPLERWAADLHAGGLTPASPGEVFELAGLHSAHVTSPLRAVCLRQLLVSDPGALERLWSDAAGLDADAIWPDLLAHLGQLAERHAAAREAQRAARRASLARRAFLRGVNLCAPAAGSAGAPERGFGTRACDTSLASLAELGANAAALCVDAIAFPGGPRTALERPSPGPVLVASDLALVATMRSAAALDLGIMLRPFVFETASGTWAGEHAEESEERHAAFFRRYRSLLLHAALVAELGGAELICAGTELPKSTRTDPDEDPWIPDFTNENTDLWRGLIAAVHGGFAGAVTYASDGRGEAERIGFWDALDHPGLDVFWPLPIPVEAPPDGDIPPITDVRPSDDEVQRRLKGALRTAAAMGAESGRPCLLTEIGFPSSSMAWQYPDQTRGGPDVEEQARLILALAMAYESQPPPLDELGGLYLWNWSTDPDAGRALDESFTPQNRPGREGLRRLFAAAAAR